MIHIIDNYYAQANNYGYTVLKERDTLDKDGNKTYATLGYCGKLKEAIRMVLKDMMQSHAEGKAMELREALQYIKDQTDRIEKAMEGIIA